MSSGAGHIMDMMNRIRQNAALKVSRRNKFKGGNKYSNTVVKSEYDFPEVSNSELERIKTKIREEASKENKKRRVYLIFFAVAVLVVFIIFNYY
ncbi:hypothetical protein [Lutibacter sp.]|uniref:hypothetical protein n=1 Tax=Lutibacter sp. TaxID=1925666 RepID=UPI00356B6037